MKAKTIKQRAGSYARGKRGSGPSDWATKVRETSHAEGWEDGYRAALRDVKQVAKGLLDDTVEAMTKSTIEVVTAAAEAFREELGKIE
jgi:flagellar biosynthesis/type III secretory pathway protein FliH